MKLLLTLTLFAAQMFAASPFDGTKGNITVSVSSTELATSFKISTIDPTYKQFAVTVWYMTSEARVRTATVLSGPSRVIDSVYISTAFLAVPESEIIWMSVSEMKVGQTQAFTR